MNALHFGFKLIELHLGANPVQFDVRRREDNLKPYRGKKIPITVTFSCTHRCNLVCVHCQAENSNTEKDIPSGRFLELIDEIADAGAVRIGFTGGEPLIRNDIGKALRRCKERGIITSLVTNGFLVYKYIEDLKNLSLLFVSLDGDQKVNDAIRGEHSFDKFVEAVELAKKHKIPVAALTTLSSMNFSVYKEMCKIITDLNIHWLVGVIQTRFTGKTDQDFQDGQLETMLAEITKIKNLRTSKGYIEAVRRNKTAEKCFAGIGYSIIAPDGMMYPCFPAQFDKTYTGVNLLKKNFGKAYQEMLLYRNTCDTCALACHLEANELYSFGLHNILQSFKMTQSLS